MPEGREDRGGRKRRRSSAGDKNGDAPAKFDHQEEGEEEARFRKLVFGQGDESLIKSFGEESVSLPGGGGRDPSSQVVLGDSGLNNGKGSADEENEIENGTGSRKVQAWIDEDDANLKVDISAKSRLKKLREVREEGKMTGPEFEQRLRNRFVSSNVSMDWVTSAEDDALSKGKVKALGRRGTRGGTSDSDSGGEDEEEVGAFLRDSTSLKGSGGGKLQPGFLDIVRCKDANQHEPSKAVVRAVSFHSAGELLLTGGLDKSLRLFQVDGVRNAKIHSIFFEDLPITNACFTTSDQAIVTGRRAYFYWYDIPTGKVQKVPRVLSSGRSDKVLENFAASPDGRWLAFAGEDGYVLLLSNRTKQWAGDFKLNSQARSLAFTPDSKFILAAGGDGEVFKFDIRSKQCVLRFYNEGGTATRAIGISSGGGGNSFTAVGSDSGVVNVYDAASLEGQKRILRPLPYKSIMSLTTAADIVKFNPDGQVMAIASSTKRDALKVVHMPTGMLFTNWPTERTPVRYPFAIDFSPSSGYLAVGNDRGQALLYRIRHYDNA